MTLGSFFNVQSWLGGYFSLGKLRPKVVKRIPEVLFRQLKKYFQNSYDLDILKIDLLKFDSNFRVLNGLRTELELDLHGLNVQVYMYLYSFSFKTFTVSYCPLHMPTSAIWHVEGWFFRLQLFNRLKIWDIFIHYTFVNKA